MGSRLTSSVTMILFRVCRSLSYESRRRLVDRGFAGALAVLSLVAGCAPSPGRLPSPAVAPLHFSFAVDTLRSTRVAAGVMHDYVWSPAGPWAIHVLRVDRDSCWQLAAAKAGGGAIGRAPVSALVGDLASHQRVVAGVNADFFLFTPPGVPRGAHLQEGRIIAGPGDRPVIAADSSGALFVGRLDVTGRVIAHGDTIPLRAWNRTVPRGVAYVDRAWGAASDSGTGRVEVVVSGAPLRVVTTDTSLAGVPIPIEGAVLVAGHESDPSARAALLALRPGDTVTVDLALSRPHLRTVVGGWPIIVRDSVVTRAADSAGASFAPVRHPRTAIGLARHGRELILVVVDGRQKPYSDGMTLRELAELFRALGATEVLNLDGGGSSAFVLADSMAPTGVRVLNSPSDKVERAVGNALAIVRGCQAKP